MIGTLLGRLSQTTLDRIERLCYTYNPLKYPQFYQWRNPMSEHHVVHVEFSAQDREAAGMNYTTFDTGDVGGGFNPVSENNPAGTVLVYIGTDDIDASLAKAESLGGRTVTPKTEIPGTGWFGFFSDPTGNMIGLFTALESEE
jgi:predicted enzyme related to lactoylglutathione lyase